MIYDVIGKEKWFPEWDNNKDKDPKDKVWLMIQPPSGSTSGKASMAAFHNIDDPDSFDPVVWDFCSFCTEVGNLQIRDKDGKTKNVTPIDIVIQPVFYDLFIEAREYYKEKYGVDKKK